MLQLILRTLSEESLAKSFEFISYQAKRLSAETSQLQDSLSDLIVKVEDDLDRGSLPHNLASIDQKLMETSLILMQINSYTDYINSVWEDTLRRITEAAGGLEDKQ